MVTRLIERRDRLIGTLLIGNNLVNILASSLTTSLLIGLFGDSGVAIATVAMTVLLVIFSEVLPKSWAIASPDRFALAVAPWVRPFVAVVGPVSSLVNAIVRRILHLFGINLSSDLPMLTAHEELRGAVNLLHREGSVIKADRDRLGGVLDLGELEVSDVMIHRTGMRAINADDPPQTCVREILESPFTRLPLWRGSADNIIGVVHSKDLLRALAEPNVEPETLDIVKIAQKPWFVPDSTNLKDQLNAFLRRKLHLAIVVDEYGQVQGSSRWRIFSKRSSATLPTSTTSTSRAYVRRPTVRSSSMVPCRSATSTGRWTGVAGRGGDDGCGLVIHESKSIPEERQAFTFYGKRFTVMKRVKNRITKLRIRAAEDEGQVG